MEGKGPYKGLVYHIFIPFPVGVTKASMYSAIGGTYTGHKDNTKLSSNMPLLFSRLRYTTVIHEGQLAITPE